VIQFLLGFGLGSLLVLLLEFFHYIIKDVTIPLSVKPWKPITVLCSRVGHDFRVWNLNSSSICHRCGKRVDEC